MEIDLSNDDFGAVLNCAVRYACGRRTYMPSIVVSVILPMVPKLNDRTLQDFYREVSGCSSWGDPCDAVEWTKFMAAVRAELNRRGYDENTDYCRPKHTSD